MSSIEQGLLGPPQRIAVLRALKLGDLLCAVPAIRALRRAWPHSEITLVGLPWAAEFSARFSHLIDRFIAFPGWPGLPERMPNLQHIPAFIAEMQQQGFDFAVQLHGSGRFVNEIVALWHARQTAGFYLPDDFRPEGGLFLPWPQHGLEIHRLLALVEHLGIEPQGDALEFPLRENDFERLAQLPGAELIASGPYVVVHPGASIPARRWPAQHFAQVATCLAQRGYSIVLTGSASEAPLAEAVFEHLDTPALDLVGQTDLGTLGALLSGAALLVANDTGVSHLAAALAVPSVIVSTGDNPSRWAPLNRRLHRVLCSSDGVAADDVESVALELLDECATQRNPSGSAVTSRGLQPAI